MNDITSPNVFLGAPAILTAQQQSYLELWLEWLKGRSLEVVRLERGDYGQDSWRALKGLLMRSDGAALLGFRQLDARAAIWRPNTNEEKRGVGWWSSSWLHLEAGMAIALGLPLLVAPDEGVEEGIFNSDLWGTQVHGATVSAPGDAGDEWFEAVRRHWISRRSSDS